MQRGVVRNARATAARFSRSRFGPLRKLAIAFEQALSRPLDERSIAENLGDHRRQVGVHRFEQPADDRNLVAPLAGFSVARAKAA